MVVYRRRSIFSKILSSTKNNIVLKDIWQTLALKQVESIDTPVSYFYIILINSLYTLSIIVMKMVYNYFLDGCFLKRDNNQLNIFCALITIFMQNCIFFFVGYIYISLYQTNSYSRCVFLYTLSYIYWPLICILFFIIMSISNDQIALIVYMILASGIVSYVLTINLGRGYDIEKDYRSVFLFQIVNSAISIVILLTVIMLVLKNI